MLFRRKTTSHSSSGKPWGTSKALSNEIHLLLTSSRHSGKNEHKSYTGDVIFLKRHINFIQKGTKVAFLSRHINFHTLLPITFFYSIFLLVGIDVKNEIFTFSLSSDSITFGFYNCSIAAANMVVYKGTCQKLLRGFFPLRGGGLLVTDGNMC